jgi:hypothetical protein
VDLFQSDKKERKKVIAKRKANAKKTKKRLEKEPKIDLEKSKKEAAKLLKKRKRQTGRTLVEGASFGGQDTFPPASTPFPVSGPRKQDTTFARLLALRLQQGIIPTLQDIGTENLVMDEFIVIGSNFSIDEHFTGHKSFFKVYKDLIMFLELVCVTLLQSVILVTTLFSLSFFLCC